MVFSIGTYSILIESYTYKDLELDESYANTKFDLYQRVFYILYLPIKPTEKYWKVRDRETNKEVTTNPEIRTKLNLIALKRRSPIWSYLGMIFLSSFFLLFLGFFIFYITKGGVESVQKRIEKNARNGLEVERINKPEIEDIYYIKMLELASEKNSNGKVVKLKRKWVYHYTYKLTNFTSDSIYLKLIKETGYTIKEKLKKHVSFSKNDLIDISEKYGNINFIDRKSQNDISKEYKLVFAIDEIERLNK